MIKIRKLNENGQAAAYAMKHLIQDPNSEEGKQVIQTAMAMNNEESTKFIQSVATGAAQQWTAPQKDIDSQDKNDQDNDQDNNNQNDPSNNQNQETNNTNNNEDNKDFDYRSDEHVNSISGFINKWDEISNKQYGFFDNLKWSRNNKRSK